MRNDLGAAPLFDKRALRQVRRAHVLLMPLGDEEVIEAGRGIVEQAPTRFRKLALITAHAGLPPLAGRLGLRHPMTFSLSLFLTLGTLALSNLTDHARDLRMGIASAILPLGQ